VEDAIDAVRTAGVDEVGLLTQKREVAGGAGGQ
jgi:biopolymer transport protein ExbD/biopolymer transport protein TolR